MNTVLNPCHVRPKDSKAMIGAIGKDLVRQRGRQRYYAPADVRRSAERLGYPIDLHCWAYCTFCTPADFAALHQATGEACDYVAMKAEVLSDLASGASFSLFDVDLSWLEWPDIDLSAIFDTFDFTP